MWATCSTSLARSTGRPPRPARGSRRPRGPRPRRRAGPPAPRASGVPARGGTGAPSPRCSSAMSGTTATDAVHSATSRGRGVTAGHRHLVAVERRPAARPRASRALHGHVGGMWSGHRSVPARPRSRRLRAWVGQVCTVPCGHRMWASAPTTLSARPRGWTARVADLAGRPARRSGRRWSRSAGRRRRSSAAAPGAGRRAPSPRRTKPRNSGCGPVRAGLELRVRLGRDEPRVVGQLDELHQPTVGREPGEGHAGVAEDLAVGVGELEAVAVALVDDLAAVGLARARALHQPAGYAPRRIVPPLSSTSTWSAIRSITRSGALGSNSDELANVRPRRCGRTRCTRPAGPGRSRGTAPRARERAGPPRPCPRCHAPRSRQGRGSRRSCAAAPRRSRRRGRPRRSTRSSTSTPCANPAWRSASATDR